MRLTNPFRTSIFALLILFTIKPIYMLRRLLYTLLLVAPLALFAQHSKPKNGTGNVPEELVGHWQIGTFSLTNFWNPATGQYVGNAGEASRSYRIAKDGTAEEFFIYNSASYNCRTQI